MHFFKRFFFKKFASCQPICNKKFINNISDPIYQSGQIPPQPTMPSSTPELTQTPTPTPTPTQTPKVTQTPLPNCVDVGYSDDANLICTPPCYSERFWHSEILKMCYRCRKEDPNFPFGKACK